MRCFKIVLFLVVLSLTNLSFSNAASIVLESTFDNDDDGWSIRGDGSDITYHASGGNPYPGGFISAKDWGAETWFFLAPDTWAGDWTSYIGGILSFDLKLIAGDSDKYFSAGDVIIETEDREHYAQWSSGIDPGLGMWTHYEVRISESNFEIVGNRTWNEILSNVTSLLIRGEHTVGPDTEGIDNIRVVDSLGLSEIIGTWDNGIWYWDFGASAWTRMTAFDTTGDIAAGDFTGDGKADVASSWEDDGLWYQDGATLAWKKLKGSAPDSVTAGDVTGDGRFEIIGTWSLGIWYWGLASSAWTQMTSYATDGDIAAGDFTGDGKADVASIWSDGLWYQDGATLAWTKIDSLPPFRVTAGDVTGDGRDEIIGTWDNGIWYWDLVASAWTQMTSYATDGDIAAGDFTGDGKADVASIWSDGLWCQDGATLAWKKVSNSAPDRLTAGDVTPDRNDNCPSDPNKTEPGICGCGVSDTDSDVDGTPDCLDSCPADPNKTEPGTCGCGIADVDTDGDGTLDCNDNCPSDPGKTEPGLCGCGTPDTDTDGDGTPDCNDNCPDVANENQEDSDGDGVGDACDELSFREMIENLEINVQEFIMMDLLSKEDGKKLIKKLDEALKNVKEKKLDEATEDLEKFIKEVEILIKKGKLEESEGQALIDQADEIIAALGG